MEILLAAVRKPSNDQVSINIVNAIEYDPLVASIVAASTPRDHQTANERRPTENHHLIYYVSN